VFQVVPVVEFVLVRVGEVERYKQDALGHLRILRAVAGIIAQARVWRQLGRTDGKRVLTESLLWETVVMCSKCAKPRRSQPGSGLCETGERERGSGTH
jgi:hypothetical protein